MILDYKFKNNAFSVLKASKWTYSEVEGKLIAEPDLNTAQWVTVFKLAPGEKMLSFLNTEILEQLPAKA